MLASRESLAEKLHELSDTYLDELAEFMEYLFWKEQSTKATTPLPPIADDPIIGLFAGASDLAEKSEEILAQEI